MDWSQEYERIVRSGFNHPRTPRMYPELPPGYDWKTQMKKYCPQDFYWNSEISKVYNDLPEEPEEPKRKFGIFKSKPRRRGYRMDQTTGNSIVFCHRGLYDRALKIPENSTLAIDHGIEQGLFLHELDARLGPVFGEQFLAHDEVASRVTSKARRWGSLNLSEIIETALVTRRFSMGKEDFASTYQDTNDNVPDLPRLLAYRYSAGSNGGCTFQIDLRGNDFPMAIAWYTYQHMQQFQGTNIMLKGYNLTFPHGEGLEETIRSLSMSHYKKRFDWGDLAVKRLRIVMVFYSQPIIALALRARGIDPDTASQAQRSSLDYKFLEEVATQHILSFTNIMVPSFSQFIPEIVVSGLGLGYDVQSGKAVNPLDGSTITDPAVILESRIERAMMEVGSYLRVRYPEMSFSSCTRLCEVRTANGELVADMKTGRLKPKPVGEKGLSSKLRTIHGGLFPQSDMVVADDPFAEIAARTWIDEYAKLDRRLLTKMPYDTWLAKAGPEVVAAVDKLNGPFLPNTFDGPLDENWNVLEFDKHGKVRK